MSASEVLDSSGQLTVQARTHCVVKNKEQVSYTGRINKATFSDQILMRSQLRNQEWEQSFFSVT